MVSTFTIFPFIFSLLPCTHIPSVLDGTGLTRHSRRHKPRTRLLIISVYVCVRRQRERRRKNGERESLIPKCRLTQVGAINQGSKCLLNRKDLIRNIVNHFSTYFPLLTRTWLSKKEKESRRRE